MKTQQQGCGHRMLERKSLAGKNVFLRRDLIFFLTIALRVTLVQHRTLHRVHFFLDFVFH
jgi:hypothetical protein